jgi:hypothetical protein
MVSNILNKLSRNICKLYINFLHNFFAKGKIPLKSIFVLLVLRIVECKPLVLLFVAVYLLGFLIFFFGVAHKKFGQFVCQFLKKYTTTVTFDLLGNMFGSTILAAMKLTHASTFQQLGALTGTVGVTGLIFLGVDHGISKFQVDTMAVHAAKVWFNNTYTGAPFSPMDVELPPTESILESLAKKTSPK